ncbi:MAG: glycosyl transferase family 2, partial [Prevotella sp.]|nr:glycosyl transferase family 2 [Prevotella sp.]
MTIDLLTITAGAILLILALLTPLMNPFFRRIRKTQVSASGEQPPVTILLVSNGDHVALDEHLPIFLTQEYSPGYEVVVVTEKADVETENVLKRYSQNERLYHTFVPESSRYMSKSKLAITLGVKAAKNEW